MPYHCARSHFLKDWDFIDPYVVMLYWLHLNPLSSSKSKKSIEHDYIRIIKVSVFQAMGSSTGVRHEGQEVSSTVLGSRVQLLLEVSFLLIFFSLIQFWQIWQNDLFTENLDCNLPVITENLERACTTHFKLWSYFLKTEFYPKIGYNKLKCTLWNFKQ